MDIARDASHHQQLESNANCLFEFLRYFSSHNLCLATPIVLENMVFVSACPGWIFFFIFFFFSSDAIIKKRVTADFVSLTVQISGVNYL